ncbi:MAG: sigma-54-dependent Fis family transcriptional regulator [Rhodospirillales bacterium]|nr:MAG: sigma-54-dependent Fis family transcriptional regulator [Rhodospirillales bacterium]
MSLGVLIIEDEPRLAKNIRTYLNRCGFTAETSDSGLRGIAEAERFKPDIVLLDFNLPDLDGLEIMSRLRRLDPKVRIIMMTGEGSIELAVKAMKAGAHDYLTKPLVLKELKLLLEKAVGQDRLEDALSYYQRKEAEKSGLDKLLGESAPMLELKRKLSRFIQSESMLKAGTPPCVLITGETGTGKELVARAIHFGGPRRERPFIEINCAAIPSHLLESELFGYERGAFTDARERKRGLVEAADGGTLFLDEIGDIDPAIQGKLLRLLEDRVVRRLGGIRDNEIDVRIVAATNQPLETRVREGQFRSDLYYRLRVLQLELPPLRERGKDVQLLADRFLAEFCDRYAKPAMRFSDAARQRLSAHDWPGNVRELRNSIEQIVLLAHDAVIEPDQLVLHNMGRGAEGPPASSGDAAAFMLPEDGLSLEDLERRLVVQALEQTRGNVTKAAGLLGLSRDTLRYRMEKFRLNRAS